MAETLLLQFDGLSRPVALVGCVDFAEEIPALFRGWHFSSAASEGDPVLTLTRTGGSYDLTAPWLSDPMRLNERVDAICALVAELVQAYVRDHPAHLCLHGAAAVFAGRLVVFPSYYRAGKSVLTTCLAATGTPLFSDDVLPVGGSQDQVIALGIAPRLRLPLPDGLSVATRSFIDRHRGLCGRRYLYLDLPTQGLAKFGTVAPIGGFVLLDRSADTKTQIEPVAAADVLRQVILRNFARQGPAPDILERLHRIVGQASHFRLRYSDADEAAAFIQEHFRTWPDPTDPVEVQSEEVPQPSQAAPDRNLDRGYCRRNPEIRVITLDGESFLAGTEGTAIHSLDAIGSAIWQLLAEPISVEEIIALMQSAFPDTPPERIASDIGTLIAGLAAKDLVHWDR